MAKDRSLKELLEYAREESIRAVEYEENNQLLEVVVPVPGPIGLMVFGDPHIDNAGRDINMLQRHLDVARDRRNYVFAGNIGDVRDNWIGRLARLYADQTITARESWKLAEWMIKYIKWSWLIKGNHDTWSGANDPLDWICEQSGVGFVRDAGVRIQFNHPNGQSTRLHARHDFPGNSIYNPLHALKRETLHGHRDHILVAGHRHIGADAGDYNSSGAFQMVRVSGYKVSDSFRHAMGFKARPLHPAAMIIVDPDEPDTSRARAWCAPTVETGALILDDLRARWKAKAGVNKRRTGKAKAKDTV
jgi:hypothetical protein